MAGIPFALAIIGACVGLAVGGLWLCRTRLLRIVPRQNDLAAAVIGLIGTIYGVLLALVTVTVLERYMGVEGLIVTEASLVWDLHRNAGAYPPATATVLQRDLRDYVAAVINEEWPAMRQQRETAAPAAAVTRYMHHLLQVAPLTTGDTVLHLATVQRADAFLEARRQRLFSGRTHLAHLMWFVLLVGAIVTVGSSYLFWAESLSIHAVLTGALAAVIGLTLYLIASLDHPLWGPGQSLTPEDFQLLLPRMTGP